MIPAVVERCAGIDIARKVLNVCVMTGPLAEEPQVELREFGTHPAALESLRQWLKQAGCTHVAMESTGSYWKPLFEVLEADFRVVLANPEDVKGRRGHKTDWQDCQMIAHLLRHGLIRASFIPPGAIRDLRDLTRRRRQLIGDAVSERNRVQKVLDEANVGLGRVLGDVFGVSGQLMIEKLLTGETDAAAIAELAQRSAKRRIPELIQAMEGHRMRDHHRRLIRLSFEHLSFLENQIADIDGEILRIIEESGLMPAFNLLLSLPGVQQTAAMTILAEAGPDMTVFPDAGHLSSWAGLAPGNHVSGGKAKRAGISRGNRWLRGTMVECAWAATRKKDCPLKEQFSRLAHKGRKIALVAVAHSLIILVHKTLSTGQPYCASDRPPLDEHRRQSLIRHYFRRLGKLGVEVSSLRVAAARINRNTAGTKTCDLTNGIQAKLGTPLPRVGPLRPDTDTGAVRH